EGAGNLKYVEIHNNTDDPINLQNMRLRRYTNGSVTVSGTYSFPNTTLAARDFFVIYYNEAAFDAVYSPTQRDDHSGHISHNGDDNYDLYDDAAGEIVDTFAGDLVGQSTNFNNDLTAWRRMDQLPN